MNYPIRAFIWTIGMIVYSQLLSCKTGPVPDRKLMTGMSNSQSKVLKVKELRAYLEKEKRTKIHFDEQLRTNLALVYYLRSGKVILMPNDWNDTSDGLLFETKDYFYQCKSRDTFPIDNPRKTIFEKCPNEIMHLNTNMNEIFNQLDSTINGSSDGRQMGRSSINDLLARMKLSHGKIPL